MKPTTTRKTTGAVTSVALLVTAVILGIGSAEGQSDGADDPDWFHDRAVIAFRDEVPADAAAWVEGLGGEVLLVNHVLHFILAEFPTQHKASQAIDRAAVRDDIRYAEHDAVIHLDEPVEVVILEPDAAGDSYTPNNPLWPQQWGPAAIRAPDAWDITLGDHQVRLGIADTGVTGHHENLVGNVCGPHISGSTDALATSGHGTHVAGIAAGVIDGGAGIAGISQSCLMSIRVLGGGSAAMAAAIVFAADNDAAAINMSFWTTQNQVFRDALNYAYLQQDVVLVKSAGNGGCSGGTGPANVAAHTSSHTMTWPGPEPSVVATAALVAPGTNTASFSSCGNKMELAAPGQGIIGPYNNGYASLSGTSMAAPHVTGLVGLMRAANPDLTALEVRCLLALSADDLGRPGWDPFFGWGRINAEQAVLAAQSWDAGTLRQSGSMMTCGLPLTA